MNINIAPVQSEQNEKAYVVLSIFQMRAMLKAARKAARKSSAHPGKAPGHFCRVIRMDLLPKFDNVEYHASSPSFMDSALAE